MALAVASPAIEAATPQRNRLRSGFTGMCENLLSAVADVFPECDATQHALLCFRTLVKGDDALEDKFIRKCQKVFKGQSECIRKKDPEAIFAVCEGIEVLKGIDLRNKWDDEDFAEESKANLWSYLLSLQTYADLYTCVPARAMEKIEKLASEVGSQINSSGEIDLKNLDLNAFGRELVGGMTPEEIEQLESNLPDITSCVGNVAALLGSGGAPAGGGLDVAGLMSKVAELQATKGADKGDPADQLGALGPLLSAALGPSQHSGGDGLKLDPSQLMSLAQKLMGSNAVAPAAGAHADGPPDLGGIVRTISNAAGCDGGQKGWGGYASPDHFAADNEAGGARVDPVVDSAAKKRKKAKASEPAA